MRTPFLPASSLAGLVAAGAFVALTLAALPALSRERQSEVTGPRGKTATHQVTRKRGQVTSSSTGPNGKTTSREVERTKGQTQATVTGPDGKTLSRQTERSNGEVQSTLTGPKGKTVTRTSSPGSSQ